MTPSRRRSYVSASKPQTTGERNRQRGNCRSQSWLRLPILQCAGTSIAFWVAYLPCPNMMLRNRSDEPTARAEQGEPNAAQPAPEGHRVPLAIRASIALLGGSWGAFITYFSLIVAPSHLAKDFSWPWRAARVLIEGHNPYDVIRATGPYPFNVGLFYPLPAVIAALPFATLRPEIAGACFFGLSSGLLAFGLTRTRSDLSKLPVFVSAPFCMAGVLVQWAPLMTATAALPALQFLAVCKPNIGLACWTYRPTVRGAVAAAAFAALTLLIVPSWPLDWRDALQAAPRYKGPLFRGVTGLLLLVGAIAWRRREGRIFLAMSVVPQLSLFYDQLPLWLIPQTIWRSVLLSALSWVAWWQWYPSRALTSSVAVAAPWVFWLIYMPTLAILILPLGALRRRQSPVASEVSGD